MRTVDSSNLSSPKRVLELTLGCVTAAAVLALLADTLLELFCAPRKG